MSLDCENLDKTLFGSISTTQDFRRNLAEEGGK